MTLRARLLIDYYIGGFAQACLKPIVIALGYLLRRDHRLDEVKEVVIVKLLGGGSLVLAYPALRAIRALPNVKRMRLLASPATKPFAELLGIFDEIIVIRESGVLSLLIDSARAIWRLWRCDTMIDLEIHSRLSTIFCLLTGARNRVGFYTQESFWRRGLSTHLLFCQLGAGIYLFYDQVAQLFGTTVEGFRENGRALREVLGITPQRTSPHIDENAVALAPCCSELGRERMLEVQEWVQVLAARFSQNGPRQLHLLGSPAEKPYLQTLQAALSPALAGVEVINQAGSVSLADAVRLIARMKEMFAIDSSMLHFARLLGVPTVSYWGPTDPATRLRPSELAQDETCYAKLPCSPCVHISSRTPCGGNNLCIRFAVNPQFPGNRNPPWLAQAPTPELKVKNG